MGKLRTMSGGEFARRLRSSADAGDMRYAFFLGAGCSASAGIPTAGNLVATRWLPRLRVFAAPDAVDDSWISDEIPAWDEERPAASYGEVMERLFITAEDRQREIEALCDGKYPSFGYAVLASLMARPGGAFSVALTTNFDDLLADALYLFTSARPLVVHHESLASFIRPTRTRPMIVKLHGDHRLAPLNTNAETDHLKQQLQEYVPSLLHDGGLVVIGYGGNDEGIASLFRGLPPEALPLGIFWVSKSQPANAVTSWLEERNATWVQESDFDETMLLAQDAFELPHPTDREIRDVFLRYRETYERLSAKIVARKGDTEETVALQAAVRRTDEAAAESWWRVALEVERLRESDRDAAAKLLDDGLTKYPESVDLMTVAAVFFARDLHEPDRAEAMFERAILADAQGTPLLANYAVFLGKERRDFDRAEEMYKRALSADPHSVRLLTNFALFLANDRNKLDPAEEMYERAVAADPQDARALAGYAGFLADERKQVDRAQEMYERAISADAQDAQTLADYAAFLANSLKELDRAEEVFERAISVDSERPDIRTGYAIFLADERKELDRAEKMHELAVSAEPPNAADLAVYAVFLDEDRKELDRAEEMYERAISADPNYTQALTNYAIFLADDRKELDRAEAMHERAISADPEGTLGLTNYAVFLADDRKELNRAEELFERAISLDPQNSRALIANAIFLADDRKELDRAEEMFERAISLDPQNSRALIAYAIFLADDRKELDRAEEMFERAISLDPQNANALSRYAMFLTLVREDTGRAAEFFGRAVDTGAAEAQSLSNYAAFLFGVGEAEAAESVVATAEAAEGWTPVLALGTAFNRFANGAPANRAAALAKVKELLKDGVRCDTWNFDFAIKRARESAHPELDEVVRLAQVVTGGRPLDELGDSQDGG
jgi:Tfp pilus assembly protein PilF